MQHSLFQEGYNLSILFPTFLYKFGRRLNRWGSDLADSVDEREVQTSIHVFSWNSLVRTGAVSGAHYLRSIVGALFVLSVSTWKILLLTCDTVHFFDKKWSFSFLSFSQGAGFSRFPFWNKAVKYSLSTVFLFLT